MGRDGEAVSEVDGGLCPPGPRTLAASSRRRRFSAESEAGKAQLSRAREQRELLRALDRGIGEVEAMRGQARDCEAHPMAAELLKLAANELWRARAWVEHGLDRFANR